MITDSYMFVTECLYLYNNGMREAVKTHLRKAYGQEWWSRGVETPFVQYRRDFDIQWQLKWGLGVGLYPPVIKANINNAFRGVFQDPEEAHWNLLKIRDVRNDWAHHRNISVPCAQRTATWMIDILDALERAEARSIEELMEQYGITLRAAVEENAMTSEEALPPEDRNVRGVVSTLPRRVRKWWHSRRLFKRFTKSVG